MSDRAAGGPYTQPAKGTDATNLGGSRDCASGEAEGICQTATTLGGAKPNWVCLREALDAVPAERLFAWTGAYRLADGTRIDEFVHRESTVPVFVANDGRTWCYRGTHGDSVEPEVRIERMAGDHMARILAMTSCARCRQEAEHECSHDAHWGA